MSCLCSLCVTSNGVYSNIANVSEVFNVKFNQPNSFPYIDNRHYLNLLAAHAAKEISLKVMIVVEPKDSGKSEGIMQMKRLWKEAGLRPELQG